MRKTSILTIALVCVGFISQAQISKGSTFLGGSLGFSSGSSKNETFPEYKSESSSWSINPQFGKAIADNKVVGFFLRYGQSTSENANGVGNVEKTKNNSYGAGVFYRRYFPLSSRFFLFGESDLGFSIGKEERKTNDVLRYRADNSNINLGLTPGLSFAAGRKIHLEVSLNSLFSLFYQTAKQKRYAPDGTVNDTNTQKSFSLGANANGFSNLTVGIRWILPSK